MEHVPIPALLERAKAAVIDEMAVRTEAAGFDDVRPVHHGCVFRFLTPEGLRLTDMAELAGLSKQTIGEVVDELEDLGYVVRAPDPTDGRAKLVLLTAKGQRVQATARAAFESIEGEWAERFGAARAATLREVLEEIAAG